MDLWALSSGNDVNVEVCVRECQSLWSKLQHCRGKRVG